MRMLINPMSMTITQYLLAWCVLIAMMAGVRTYQGIRAYRYTHPTFPYVAPPMGSTLYTPTPRPYDWATEEEDVNDWRPTPVDLGTWEDWLAEEAMLEDMGH